MIALLAVLAMAQDAPFDIDQVRQQLPDHALVKCSGRELMCFEFEPFKDLLEHEFERLSLMTERPMLVQQLINYDQQNAALKSLVEVREQQLELLRADHQRLLGEWKEENRARHAAEMRASSPWPIVTIAVGALVGASGAIWGIAEPDSAGPWVMAGSGIVVAGVGILDFFF